MSSRHISPSNPYNHHQPTSTIINHHQPSSTIINHHQPSSTIINHHQPESFEKFPKLPVRFTHVLSQRNNLEAWRKGVLLICTVIFGQVVLLTE